MDTPTELGRPLPKVQLIGPALISSLFAYVVLASFIYLLSLLALLLYLVYFPRYDAWAQWLAEPNSRR